MQKCMACSISDRPATTILAYVMPYILEMMTNALSTRPDLPTDDPVPGRQQRGAERAVLLLMDGAALPPQIPLDLGVNTGIRRN